MEADGLNDEFLPPFADEIARMLINRLDGDIDDVKAWCSVAQQFDCILFPVYSRAVLGEMVMRPGMRPVLIYSTAVCKAMQSRIIAHEIIHWVLRGGYHIPLFPPDGLGQKTTDHQIARMAEEAIFGDVRLVHRK